MATFRLDIFISPDSKLQPQTTDWLFFRSWQRCFGANVSGTFQVLEMEPIIPFRVPARQKVSCKEHRSYWEDIWFGCRLFVGLIAGRSSVTHSFHLMHGRQCRRLESCSAALDSSVLRKVFFDKYFRKQVCNGPFLHSKRNITGYFDWKIFLAANKKIFCKVNQTKEIKQ